MTGRQSIPGQGYCSNKRQLNSSRKGRQDSHAKVQAGRGPGGWSWLDPSAGLERGRCAQPPQVWHIVPNIDKIFDIEEKPSISLYSDIAPISCTKSIFFPSISLYYDIAIRYSNRIKLRYRIECHGTTRVEIELECRTRYRRFFFDIESISSVRRCFVWSFWSVLNIVPDIIYDIDDNI